MLSYVCFISISAAFDNARKKVPPKPPPKFAKRAPVDAPSIPINKKLSKDGEGNIKPSIIQRQKSNESLEQSPLVSRKSFHSALAKSVGSNDNENSDGAVTKAINRNVESVSSTPTGSFGRVSPNSNKSQSIARTSNAGSKESLGSIGLPSDKVCLLTLF